MEGVEPTTPRLQITCSGQLSYIGKLVNSVVKIIHLSNGIAKIGIIFISANLFRKKSSFFDLCKKKFIQGSIV